ncbi:ABC transporter permease [Chitinophaga pinensis]|uniref:ABC-2 type transporter n=1 Tax=Chitinophaga pinensis (strain ATCC 43595 / DSM 2588 / LMG 13176 / NBRC 15968 / NCIMB 11800 / UQM 2034) TaxID=485918 RepID=A0A979GYK5_CHIPD|nr:ABC transporter permease [Chitinophaga pinensis]ACU63259.1 ABC-2 type transporter [Chitinophaga pinensis DSM 2588]
MAVKYNQWKALLAMSRASLKGILRSPSAVIFSLGFPLVFILVFGFIGDNGVSVKVGVDAATDTTSYLYRQLAKEKSLKLQTGQPAAEMEEDLKKGHITAIIRITSQSADSNAPACNVKVRTSKAAVDKISLFNSILTGVIYKADDNYYPRQSIAKVEPMEVLPGRRYRTIDFILPGLLSFSLLSAAVFSTAFLFFNLRQTLVLKRFFATPIRRLYIVLGEALARLVFQVAGAIVIIAIGYFAFGFTLVHGWSTFFEMLFLTAFGVVVFMGFGFVVSGIANSESTIPPIANVITLPQFLLAGTFVSVDSFPSWLQPICRIMPLTYLNDAFRKVAFEGQHLWNVGLELGVITAWGIVVYIVAVKVFRWE